MRSERGLRHLDLNVKKAPSESGKSLVSSERVLFELPVDARSSPSDGIKLVIGNW